VKFATLDVANSPNLGGVEAAHAGLAPGSRSCIVLEDSGGRRMKQRADVVVVGAGIAGSALAALLARRGLGVALLESQTTYRDRVRGEGMAPWGAAEARRLGLEDALLAAGGSYAIRVVRYDETIAPEEAERQTVGFHGLVPGIDGFLDVGHPEASLTLSEEAAQSGAVVVRGVRSIKLSGGPRPEVRYTVDGQDVTVACRLVAGADGRRSTVRCQAGIRLEQSAVRTRGGGVLVEHPEAWPQDQISLGTEGGLLYFVFPRPALTRLYLVWDAREGARFQGPGGGDRFLASFGGLTCIPHRAQLAGARAAGPCVSYPLNDAWCDRIVDDGVVLVGDAAGWNDPIIGQGLSIAMRDARLVSEVVSGGDWSPRAFTPYVEERSERIRRLRTVATLMTDLRCTFTPEGARRRKRWGERLTVDPSVFAPFLAYLRGPETLPAEVFEPAAIERVLSGN
jgi:2-polyprenyl-6-methoxyphenol hydroxylase-like FAD-dependent oxidoreductase